MTSLEPRKNLAKIPWKIAVGECKSTISGFVFTKGITLLKKKVAYSIAFFTNLIRVFQDNLSVSGNETLRYEISFTITCFGVSCMIPGIFLVITKVGSSIFTVKKYGYKPAPGIASVGKVFVILQIFIS